MVVIYSGPARFLKCRMYSEDYCPIYVGYKWGQLIIGIKIYFQIKNLKNKKAVSQFYCFKHYDMQSFLRLI